MSDNIFDKFRLDGKKALVTGATGKIGYMTAKAFAQAGADVAIVGATHEMERAQAIAEEFRRDYGVNTLACVVEVTDEESVDELFEKVVDAFGTVDVVHNNAGIGGSPIPDIDVDFTWWKHVIDVNLCGIFLIARKAARVMKEHGHGGTIINTASMCAQIVNQAPQGVTFDNSAYSVSKAAVRHFTKHFATQVIQYGIRVNSVSPGYILHEMHSNIPKAQLEFLKETQPCKRTGQPEEIQGAVLYLASDASSFAVGTDLVVDGGHTCY